MNDKAPSIPADGSSFASTQWSLVLAAGRMSSPDAHTALAMLCQTYWRPLYAYVRRHVADVPEAQDLTQEFFARLLERNDLAVADPERGRFRSFLLTALKHFMINERKKATARKRGGDRAILSLDFASADSQYRYEPAAHANPERDFDREWSVALINQVLARLRQELIGASKEKHFDHFKKHLSGSGGADGYAVTAAALDMSEGAVRTAAHRLRKRYRELLRDEIGRTVATTDEVDEEIRKLFVALAS